MNDKEMKTFPQPIPRRWLTMFCVVSLLAVWQTEFSHSKPKTKDLEEVEIEFSTSPPGVRARVMHGRKTYGVTPFKLRLPKNSGFRDIRVVAKDFLVLNTRVYTHKNQKRVLKLFKDEDAQELPGYKRKIPDMALDAELSLDAGVRNELPSSVQANPVKVDAESAKDIAPKPNSGND